MCERGTTTIVMICEKPVDVDSCIAPIVTALNAAGVKTRASCCGHVIQPGNIILEDGRELIIAPDFETARKVHRCFPPLVPWAKQGATMQVDGNVEAIAAVQQQLADRELSAREVTVREAEKLEDRPNIVFVTVRCVRLNHENKVDGDAPDEFALAARAVVAHWNNFGAEWAGHGFGDKIARLEKAICDSPAERAPNIPAKCIGCGKPLLLENLFVDDGCPCNTPRGVNFTPKPCVICGIDNCVRPGHRLNELFPNAVQVAASEIANGA